VYNTFRFFLRTGLELGFNFQNWNFLFLRTGPGIGIGRFFYFFIFFVCVCLRYISFGPKTHYPFGWGVALGVDLYSIKFPHGCNVASYLVLPGLATKCSFI
jgi:hypothetical protein